MIKELWQTFPRMLEQHINGLLDQAEPTPVKAFHLYKACQSEGLWGDSFEAFSRAVSAFFAAPRSQRRKSDLDALLERPVSRDVYESFHLNFRTAQVDNRSLLNIASWAHHLMRVSCKSDSAVISADVLGRTLQAVTTPGPFEKADTILFEDFCAAWKKTVFKLFGKQHDSEFQKILKELEWLEKQIRASERAAEGGAFLPTIYLTQTEIDWTLAVQRAVTEHLPVPKFPLSRGPEKQRLIDLKRTIDLYNIVRTSKTPEFVQHRDNIRATLLDRCAGLLRDKAS